MVIREVDLDLAGEEINMKSIIHPFAVENMSKIEKGNYVKIIPLEIRVVPRPTYPAAYYNLCQFLLSNRAFFHSNNEKTALGTANLPHSCRGHNA